MKKALLVVAAGLMLLSGCNHIQTTLQCDVDPDEVFGQHYDAWDFQIWYALNENDEAFRAILSTMDIDSNVTILGYGLMVQNADTAAVMAKAIEACSNYIDRDTNVYMPVWQDNVDNTSTLLFTYGFAAPDMEEPLLYGTEVELAQAQHTGVSGNELAIVFNREAAERWAQITHDGIGRNVVIMLGADREGRVLSAPRIMGEVTGGRCSVTGDFSDDETCALAAILNNK